MKNLDELLKSFGAEPQAPVKKIEEKYFVYYQMAKKDFFIQENNKNYVEQGKQVFLQVPRGKFIYMDFFGILEYKDNDYERCEEYVRRRTRGNATSK